jgi:hypothetical protein
MNLAKYKKSIVAVAGVVALVAQSLGDDGTLSVDEIVAICVAAGAALGVYAVPNSVKARKAKK